MEMSLYGARFARSIAACAVVLSFASGAVAQQTRPPARPTDLVEVAAAPQPEAPTLSVPETVEPTVYTPVQPPTIGPETNLPLPRYVSLKTDDGNVRRGPSLSHRIDWVFLRRDMPLQITAEYGHWRRVVDREGLGGWVHYALLSGSRTVIVERDMLPVRARPDDTSPITAELEAGVIARLGACDPLYCRISAGGYRGWADRTALWGLSPGEIRE